MANDWSVKYYFTPNGKRPFVEWFDGLDGMTQRKIDAYLERMRAGNFGSCKPLKGVPDICELVMDFGPGYRAYYIRAGKVLILLFTGGIKKRQKVDVKQALHYLEDFKTRWTAGTYDEPEIGRQT